MRCNRAARDRKREREEGGEGAVGEGGRKERVIPTKEKALTVPRNGVIVGTKGDFRYFCG